MQDFITYCLNPLLSHPDELEIAIDSNNVNIKVNSEDAGRVIGKGGSVIIALRSLVATYCANKGLPMVQLTLIN